MTLDCHRPEALRMASTRDLGVCNDGDPIGFERLAYGDAGVVVLGRQHSLERLDNGYVCAEARVDLRELDADRTSADHHERGRNTAVVPDSLLVRPVRAVT